MILVQIRLYYDTLFELNYLERQDEEMNWS